MKDRLRARISLCCCRKPVKCGWTDWLWASLVDRWTIDSEFQSLSCAICVFRCFGILIRSVRRCLMFDSFLFRILVGLSRLESPNMLLHFIIAYRIRLIICFFFFRFFLFHFLLNIYHKLKLWINLYFQIVFFFSSSLSIHIYVHIWVWVSNIGSGYLKTVFINLVQRPPFA